MNIAIDGPAGAGKSTVAQLVAKQLGFTYIDTGAMYRALTLMAMKNNIPVEQEQEQEQGLLDLLFSITITLKQQPDGQKVFVDDQEVTSDIRDPQVTRQVSFVAKHPRVRQKMVELQQTMAAKENVVMDGRDIGTYVLPHADLKVFLTASIEERASRRYKELVEKGHHPNLEELKQEIATRDQLDSERETAPLKCAEDAWVLDSTGLSIPDVVHLIVQKYYEKIQN